MKRNIIGLMLLAWPAALITGCRDGDEAKPDNSKYCWECTIKQTNTVPSFPELNSETTSKVEICHYSEADIRTYEKNGTHTHTATSDGASATVKLVTTCKKQ